MLLLSWGLGLQAIEAFAAQESPFFLLVLYVLQLFLGLLQQFLLHILGYMRTSSHTISLFTRQTGTSSCRSLTALAQISTVVALMVLPSFAGFTSKIQCQMLHKPGGAAWCHVQNWPTFGRRIISEGCLENLSRPPLWYVTYR